MAAPIEIINLSKRIGEYFQKLFTTKIDNITSSSVLKFDKNYVIGSKESPVSFTSLIQNAEFTNARIRNVSRIFVTGEIPSNNSSINLTWVNQEQYKSDKLNIVTLELLDDSTIKTIEVTVYSLYTVQTPIFVSTYQDLLDNYVGVTNTVFYVIDEDEDYFWNEAINDFDDYVEVTGFLNVRGDNLPSDLTPVEQQAWHERLGITLQSVVENGQFYMLTSSTDRAYFQHSIYGIANEIYDVADGSILTGFRTTKRGVMLYGKNPSQSTISTNLLNAFYGSITPYSVNINIGSNDIIASGNIQYVLYSSATPPVFRHEVSDSVFENIATENIIYKRNDFVANVDNMVEITKFNDKYTVSIYPMDASLMPISDGGSTPTQPNATHPTRSDFPASGVVGIFYIAEDTDKVYIWDAEGNDYIEVGGMPSGANVINQIDFNSPDAINSEAVGEYYGKKEHTESNGGGTITTEIEPDAMAVTGLSIAAANQYTVFAVPLTGVSQINLNGHTAGEITLIELENTGSNYSIVRQEVRTISTGLNEITDFSVADGNSFGYQTSGAGRVANKIEAASYYVVRASTTPTATDGNMNVRYGVSILSQSGGGSTTYPATGLFQRVDDLETRVDDLEQNGSGNGGGTAYDQALNTTDNVEFNAITTNALIVNNLPTSEAAAQVGGIWIDTANGNALKVRMS